MVDDTRGNTIRMIRDIFSECSAIRFGLDELVGGYGRLSIGIGLPSNELTVNGGMGEL